MSLPTFQETYDTQVYPIQAFISLSRYSKDTTDQHMYYAQVMFTNLASDSTITHSVTYNYTKPTVPAIFATLKEGAEHTARFLAIDNESADVKVALTAVTHCTSCLEKQVRETHEDLFPFSESIVEEKKPPYEAQWA